MAESATVIVKITNGTEIRRFTAQSNHLSWSSLSKNASSLFDLPFGGSLKLTYVDDEGDKITLSSDEELNEAVGLALKTSPAVLRLSVVSSDRKHSSADVQMADAATAADAAQTAEAGNQAKPATADAYTSGGDHSDEVASLLQTLAKQLPSLVSQLPAPVRNLIPRAELDVAATIAANAAANAPCAAAAAASDFMAAAAAAAAAARPASAEGDVGNGVHPGVTCDRSGMCPIVGNRYNLAGHNYDLCEAEFNKLGDKEKALYHKIPPPTAPYTHQIPPDHLNNNGKMSGVHPGVECDRSGMCPIVGIRYHLRGHNYDLCQAEFDKLPAHEKLLYTAVPPPDPNNNAGGPWRPSGHWGGGRGWGCRGWGGGGGGIGGFGQGNGFGQGSGCGPMGGGGGMGGCKLAARFVSDVTIFDGTQMAPNTNFTKIWRLKNTGEVAWPPGTKMLFVGGDQMTTEMSVPLSRATAVQPGEEVDVAVEMVAPSDLGRYLGYWRLVGPHGRRKFGQRVWCHVQVVDPAAAPPPVTEADLDRTRAEIERKKSDLAASEADADPTDDLTETCENHDNNNNNKSNQMVVSTPADNHPLDVSEASTEMMPAPIVPSSLVADDAAERASDDGVLVTVGDLDPNLEMPLTTANTTDPSASGEGGEGMTLAKVTAALSAMGFTDSSMVEVVLDKHGADIHACARDLAAATEWDPMLDDLEEMGFTNRELNKTLMLKHNGNVKRTVRELVEEA